MNNWTSFDTDEVAWWTVTFPDEVRAERLLEWQRIVLTAGERHGILRVDEAPAIGYRHDRDGSAADYVARHPDRMPAGDDHWPRGFVLPGLDPIMTPGSRVSSLLDYVDAAGRPARSWVSDLEPLGHAIGLPQHFRQPPVVLDGGYGPAGADSDDDVRWIQIGTTVDVWFPWNWPNLHPGRGPGRLDNRILARLNGSRLNAFLAEVRSGAENAGGSWSCPPAAVRHPYADCDGAILDAS